MRAEEGVMSRPLAKVKKQSFSVSFASIINHFSLFPLSVRVPLRLTPTRGLGAVPDFCKKSSNEFVFLISVSLKSSKSP